MSAKNNETSAFTVRVDKALREQVEAAAKSSFRTLSGEIASRLKNSFEQSADNSSTSSAA